MLPAKRQNSVARTPPNTVVLGDEDLKMPDTPSHEILRSTVADIRQFSRSSSMGSIVSDIELIKKVSKFEVKIASVLENIKKLDIQDDTQLQKLFLFVLQSCSDYIYVADADRCHKIKMDLCVKLLKPFVKDDETLCKSIINIVQSRVKPSTWLRRNKRFVIKVGKFFLSIFARGI